MRKLSLFILVLCLVAVLAVGCGVKPQGNDTPSQQGANDEGTNTDADTNGEGKTDTDPQQGDSESGKVNDTRTLVQTLILRDYSKGDEYISTGRTWKEDNEYCLSMWQPPTMENGFEDNIINVFFRYFFVGYIGLDYFDGIAGLDVIEMTKIVGGKQTIEKGSLETIPLYEGYSKGLSLTLSTHDKQLIIDACAYLMTLEDVLIAEPRYISYTQDCDDTNGEGKTDTPARQGDAENGDNSNGNDSYTTQRLDNIEDNKVLVCLTNKASLQFRTYTEEDFAEVNPLSVRCQDLDYQVEYIKAKMNGLPTERELKVTVETFKSWYVIILPIHSKDNVYDAIEILMQRDDIEIAEPSGLWHYDSFDTNNLAGATEELLWR